MPQKAGEGEGENATNVVAKAAKEAGMPILVYMDWAESQHRYNVTKTALAHKISRQWWYAVKKQAILREISK